MAPHATKAVHILRRNTDGLFAVLA